MAEDVKRAARKRTGWIGWTLRGLGAVIVLGALAFAGLFAWFVLVVKPQQIAAQKAEAERSAAFARLSGPERRLALYDAFVAQIDRNYYDQSFSGFDWPKMKRECPRIPLSTKPAMPTAFRPFRQRAIADLMRGLWSF